MLVIPAIDIRGGQCVRLFQGDFDQQTVYGSDPVAMALRWQDEGARMLHVVDLDGAKDGTSDNLQVIKNLAEAVGIPIEVGGGLRSVKDVTTILNFGVERVIIATAALSDKVTLKAMLDKYASRIVVALETKNSQLVSEGWQRAVSGDFTSVAKDLQKLGVQRFLYTDVNKDGTLTEPNYTEITRLLESISVPVIASGGVTTLEAVKKLKTIGAEAAIIGKALYEGQISIKEANDVS